MTIRIFLGCLLLTTLLSSESARAEPGEAVVMGPRGVSNFVAKLEKGGPAHVAFLGGSITQKETGHVKMVADWLEENWPDVDFTFTNAGLSSTCSQTGAFRLEEDVLSKGPIDLLVVEFAVNDDQDAGHTRERAIRGLEGIVRQYFRSNPRGDVISVQFVNPPILEKYEEGKVATSVAAHREVARHYEIPIVDVGRALATEIAAGRKTWDEDYGGTHPNEKGYRFASDLITGVIDETSSGETPRLVRLPEPLDEQSYSEAYSLDPEQFAWLGGWRHEQVGPDLIPVGTIRAGYLSRRALRSDEGGNYLYGTFTGRMLGVFVLAGPDAGALEISIDGGDWKRTELYHRFSSSLNYPRSVILASGLEEGFHTVAIRTSTEAHPDSQGQAATILRFQANR